MASSTAAIKIAQKQLGLDDATYRAKLMNIVGKQSTTQMTESERQQVLTVFRNDGFVPAVRTPGRQGKAALSGKYLPKMRALWIALYNLGVVDDRRDSALEAFALGRQVKGLSDVRFIHHSADGEKVIEGLKAQMTRAGVVWADRKPCEAYEQRDGYKIARAQWTRLCPQAPNDFWSVVTDRVGKNVAYRDLTSAEWITVMNYFGEQIRAAKKKAVK
jgi:hypothetical protein